MTNDTDFCTLEISQLTAVTGGVGPGSSAPQPQSADDAPRTWKDVGKDYAQACITGAGEGLMFGPYESADKLELFAADGVPAWFGADLLPEDFAAVEPNWTVALEHLPVFQRIGLRRNVRGPFQMTSTFTPFSFNSSRPLMAPALIDFQNSCVVPLGMTAIV